VTSRISPSAVLTTGLCLASAALLLWAVQVTVLDPGPLHRGAREVLSEEPVQSAMTTRLTSALVTTAPGGASIDPAATTVLVTRSLEQPAFVAAFAAALDDIQSHVVAGTEGPITLDPELVAEAVKAAGAADPRFAPLLAALPPLVIQVPDDEVPDLAQWADLWSATVRALAFFALVLLTYALLRIEHRVWAIGRIGRWAIVIGFATLALFWLLPRALLRPLGGWIAVGGAVVASGDVLVPVSLVLIGGGTLAAFGAHRWEAQDRRRLLSAIPRAPSRSHSGHDAGPWQSPV
jgi:hypothetical protein